jgi:hypothetical protein
MVGRRSRLCRLVVEVEVSIVKRAELGLLEVLGLLVRMPGEGDVTALPCFVGS